MKRCPECKQLLGMVPLPGDDPTKTCRTHKLLAGLENMQEDFDAREIARQEALDDAYGWREFEGDE